MRFIDADAGWGLADLREAWDYRELLLAFTLRDLKVRYRQAFVGVAWVVLQPLVMLLIFRVFFVKVLNRDVTASGVPYAVSAYAGLLWWQFFAGSVRDAASSLVQNRILVTRVYFPRMLLPLSAVGAALVDLGVGSVLLIVLMAANGLVPGWTLLACPVFLAFGIATVAAATIWLSALNAIYRDIGYVVPFLLQLGFFVTPVVYETADLVPAAWQWWFRINPVTVTIEGLRWSLFGGDSAAGSPAVVSALLVLVVLAGGLVYLRRVESWIADRI